MAAPAYWLTFEERPGYLFVRVQGLTDSLETSINYWQEVMLEVIAHRATRVLVRESFRNNISSAGIIEIGQFLADLAAQFKLVRLKIAFVDDDPDQFDRNRLSEQAAVNRGLNCKVFDDFAEAEGWLLAD